MKFDSHIKITSAALDLLKSSCPRPNACEDRLFNNTPRKWSHPTQSNARDNYSSAAYPTARAASAFAFKYVPFAPAVFTVRAAFAYVDQLYLEELATVVAAVDVNEAWTHDKADGQKYHFMRAIGESSYDAYMNGLGFIHFHTSQWVDQARWALRRKNHLFGFAAPSGTRHYQFELALALHCLQDSFSAGHTVRDYGPNAQSLVAVASLSRNGVPIGAPPISELHDYAAQDHKKHADDDYTSGGLKTGTGRMAVQASFELISMGIFSITAPDGLVGWDQFVSRWLPECIQSGPAKRESVKVAQGARR